MAKRKQPLAKADFESGMSILDVLVATGLAPSKGEGRRLVQQGGVSVDNEKVTDVNKLLTADDFKDGQIIIKKGKKVFHKVVIGG